MKFFQGRQCAVGVFVENYICDQCLCIHIRVGGEEETPLPASVSPGGSLVLIPSRCSSLSPIADLFVADDKLYLSCLMTEPCVTPYPTSPCSVPGSGGCPWH